jgi:hypothetical protein
MVYVGGSKTTKSIDCRPEVMRIATELLHNKNHCYYSEAPNRWDWRRSNTLVFPFTSDCSGTATAIDFFAGCGDPNGVDFGYGDTETILNHAIARRLIIPKAKLLHGDWILFGSGPKPDHVAMAFQDAAKYSNPQCFSMGRQGDPSMVLLSVLMSIGKPTYVRNVTSAR